MKNISPEQEMAIEAKLVPEPIEGTIQSQRSSHEIQDPSKMGSIQAFLARKAINQGNRTTIATILLAAVLTGCSYNINYNDWSTTTSGLTIIGGLAIGFYIIALYCFGK